MHPRQIGYRISSMLLKTSAWDVFSRHQHQQKTGHHLNCYFYQSQKPASRRKMKLYCQRIPLGSVQIEHLHNKKESATTSSRLMYKTISRCPFINSWQ
ncbi:hypothetical protein Nepgr_031756 [Nepenthes gracilis]|uniref:Uncharacterized protein n=1 Tax=Nepenthes gracilis TaxID=150966 RepID=A0AAD3THC0_NEPGR|nr:hypothetical protein Nepgr_031756 [Nepenthes gracilis]